MCLPLLKAAPGRAAAETKLHEMCERQVSRMARLVDDVLDLTRADHAKLRLDSRQVNCIDLVRSVVEDHRPLFEKRGIDLYLFAPPYPLFVMGDATRLEQVLANLLQNAAKFTDRKGYVSVSLAKERDQILLRVRDTGIGIARTALARIFQPFAQSEATLDRNGKGLGLGLALVKTLVELHGGTVAVDSEGHGKGTEFWIRLPRAKAVSRRAALTTSSPPAPARGWTAPPYQQSSEPV